MDQEPDALQTVWLVRGSFEVLAGFVALIAVFLSGEWQIALLAAVAGFGFGAFDFWMAVSPMAEDRKRRLTAPARIESAQHGLRASGWEAREQDGGPE
jgi:hypothetical protein